MKTMEEIQQLMKSLKELYTDVRLLDEETLRKIEEGACTEPDGEDLCYACRHKARLPKCSAAKKALRTRSEQCNLEYFEPDIAQLIVHYYEIDGKPYVLELVKRTSGSSLMEMEDGAQLITELSGYNTKLYHDALTGVYNRRYYEDAVRSMIGPAGVAVMDLDDFKVYNDTYGHHAGHPQLHPSDRYPDPLRRG